MEAVTRRSSDPSQLADAIALASLAARMPSAALFDDISYLLAAVRLHCARNPLRGAANLPRHPQRIRVSFALGRAACSALHAA